MRWLPSSFLLLTFALAASAAASPRAVLDESLYDFGAVERGTRVTHVFKIRNDGDAPLVIERVEPACACTVGTLAGRVVAPGADTWIGVDLDTRALAGETAKSVVLQTSDPAAREMRLLVQGTVLADLVADPALLYLGEVRRGTGVERAVRVRAGRPGAETHLERVEARGPFVVARLEGEAAQQHVVVGVADGAPVGRFRDEIVVHGTAGERMVVPVLGVVRAELDVTPPVVEVTRGQARAVVQVVNRGARPVSLREIKVPPDVGTCELETVRRGFEYVLHLALRGGLDPRAQGERIQILTDHPTEQRLEVPLAVVARAATPMR